MIRKISHKHFLFLDQLLILLIHKLKLSSLAKSPMNIIIADVLEILKISNIDTE